MVENRMRGQQMTAASQPAETTPGVLGGVRLNAPRIAIEGLDFFYGSHKALKGIRLDLPEKQVTGMIGPSGCGKSTLLRVLNRMYDLYPGSGRKGG